MTTGQLVNQLSLDPTLRPLAVAQDSKDGYPELSVFPLLSEADT